MIQPGNQKLGSVPCFSLLAVKTCPGKTSTCAESCYATKSFFQVPSVQTSQRRNWRASKKDNFVVKMINEIRQMKLTLLRVHVAGDFYDEAYVRKWIQIAKKCPDVTFYAYTRSWRCEELLPALRQLSRLKNFQLWWSTDSETVEVDGKPPKAVNTKIAHMQGSVGETTPAYADLVFRVKRKVVEKFINGVFVCPAENGIKPKKHCEQCKLCWSAAKLPKKKTMQRK